MKNIAVLGSTGSIGTQTLDVVRANPERLCVKALAAGHNITQLESQIREFHPQIAAVWDEEKAKELRICTADLPVKIVSGMEGLLEIAQMEEAEVLVTAIVGMIGIRPTIAAIKAGKDIALANKETLVTAGHIIMPLAKEYNVKILPVDSEHSAIFQSFVYHTRRIDRDLMSHRPVWMFQCILKLHMFQKCFIFSAERTAGCCQQDFVDLCFLFSV